MDTIKGFLALAYWGIIATLAWVVQVIMAFAPLIIVVLLVKMVMGW